MLLYCTPAGTWAGTEADYKKALKSEGIDPKSVSRRQVEVPVKKAELLEFLTFHGVNPIGGRVVSQVVGDGASPLPPAPSPAAPATTATAQDAADLDALFDEAPLGVQLRLSMFAINRAKGQLAPGT